jgi:hypothetical protein
MIADRAAATDKPTLRRSRGDRFIDIWRFAKQIR